MITKTYCNDYWRLYDAVREAENQRAFVAQQVRDVGSMQLIHAHVVADKVVRLAQAALDAHRMSCDKCKVTA